MPDTLDPAAVQHLLHLPDDSMKRLAQLRRPVSVPTLELPDPQRAEHLLRRFGVDVPDQVDVLAARPDPEEHPALWWVMDRVYHDMLANMGEPVPIAGFASYPALPASTGALGRHLPVWTFLALVPAIRRFHTDRGIPDAISWGSLGEALARVLRAHRSVTGMSGLGLWGFGWTLPLRFRGVDYQLGRLGYHLGEMSLSTGACGYVLGVHIPPGEPLDLDACVASMEHPKAFFARHFPDRPASCFMCESWLMDPQFADYLDSRSNIIGFQHLFSILPLLEHQKATARSDETILGYAFEIAADDSLDIREQAESIPQETSLQRAYVQHLRSGRHWHVRTGWRPIQ